MKVLVTGANGFVGRALCQDLLAHGYGVRALVRTNEGRIHYSNQDIEQIVVGQLEMHNDWQSVLTGVDTVIHLAGLAHVLHDKHGNQLAAYRAANVESTKKIALAATSFGVKRFIYLSSIKVNGDSTSGTPFKEIDTPNPVDYYGLSKLEAEEALQSIGLGASMETVIIRSPLIYGPGVKANFKRLMDWVDKGVPFPFKNLANKRSMLYVGNLTSALIACIEHPNAAGKIYLLSDAQDLSTSALVQAIADIMCKPLRLWFFPRKVLSFTAKLLGRSDELSKLVGSLQVDSSKIVNELGWVHPFTVDEGIRETVVAYYSAKRKTCSRR